MKGVNDQCDVSSHSLEVWHKIMGHCNTQDILKLEKEANGMRITSKNKFNCAECFLGKMTNNRSRIPDAKAKSPLSLVHTDLAGPIDPAGRDGYRYCMNFVDDYSGMQLIYLLKSKADATKATEKFLADVAPIGSVKCMRADNGTEYTSDKFRNLMLHNKIKLEFSSPYSPHQNGTAERNWRTIFDMSRCLLLQSQLPKSFWTYAVKTAMYIRNRCFCKRISTTPYQLFVGKKPNLSNMHAFGSQCYGYLQEKKLDPRSKKGIFVGLSLIHI